MARAPMLRERVQRMPALIDQSGKPLMGAAYDAAERYSRELSSWQPVLRSPDAEILPEWDVLVSRQRDMIRNHGLASGAVQTHLDNVISTGLRCVPKPDWRALGQTVEWAEEWEQVVKSRWRQFADDVDCYIDFGRRLTFDGLLAQMYRSYLMSTEIVAKLEWKKRHPDRNATCVNVIQPDLLSNPDGAADSWTLRAGVKLDKETREPLGYWFRQVHPNEPATLDAPLFTWRFVPAYTSWGRRNVIHIFDPESPGQTRGKPSFASVLAKMRMLDRFEKTTLQAAIVNAMYAAVIESSLDHSQVATALGVQGDETPLEGYMGAQAIFHEKGTVFADGVKIPHLVPGEQLKFLTPGNPSPAFDQFEQATLRHLAAGLNLSYEQLSRDYSRTNYSSARASAMEAWRFFMGRRHYVGARAASMIYVAWMEEEIDRGFIQLPSGAPDFYSAKTAYTRCLWIGAPRGHIDEEKEMKARKLKYSLGMVTHEDLCAEEGRDADEVIEQLAREKIKFDKAKLPMPGSEPPPAEPAADADSRDAAERREANA
jgi:lambda family phage portal protein